MNTIQEFLPLIFVVAFVVISVRSNMNKKKQEEMAKTMLPGRKSGPVLSQPVQDADLEESIAAEPETLRKAKHTTSISSRAIRQNGKELQEEASEPVLNLDDPDELQKAVIYTEIFNRKDF
jgi:hypothetical protein